MISCEEALELMSLELDGLLEEPDRRRLEEHVGQCAACRDLRKDLGEMHQAFPQLEAEVPKDFAQNVLDALPSRRPLYCPRSRPERRPCRTGAAVRPASPERGGQGCWGRRRVHRSGAVFYGNHLWVRASTAAPAREIQRISDLRHTPSKGTSPGGPEERSKISLTDGGGPGFGPPPFLDKTTKEVYDRECDFH